MPELTARQMQVAIMVGRGMSTTQIADELSISAGFVKIMISRMYQVLGIDARECDGRVKLANMVRERGWK